MIVQYSVLYMEHKYEPETARILSTVTMQNIFLDLQPSTFFAHNFIEIMLAFRFIPRVVALCCLFVESCMYVHDHKFAKYEPRPWYRAPSLSPSDLIISGYL